MIKYDLFTYAQVHNYSHTLTSISMLQRFFDIPADEKSRLAAWGITPPDDYIYADSNTHTNKNSNITSSNATNTNGSVNGSALDGWDATSMEEVSPTIPIIQPKSGYVCMFMFIDLLNIINMCLIIH